ncbi:MAG: hypothetical protein LKE40_14765 [Spirochaetia bacterium]|jgi:hypothetical protein|nr:hypothetical protein [Spirochaetia bacterium]
MSNGRLSILFAEISDLCIIFLIYKGLTILFYSFLVEDISVFATLLPLPMAVFGSFLFQECFREDCL